MLIISATYTNYSDLKPQPISITADTVKANYEKYRESQDLDVTV